MQKCIGYSCKIMLFIGSVLFLFCVASTQAFYAATGCTFNLMSDDREPVIFINGNAGYVLPEERPTIQVDANTELRLSCSGSANSFKLSNTYKTLQGECLNNEIFIQDFNKAYSIDDLHCTAYLYGDVLSTTQSCANGNGVIYQIGHKVTETQVLPLYEVCHQQNTGITFYSQHEFHHYSHPGTWVKLKKPTFQQGPFFREMKSIYTNQENILAALIGETEKNNVYGEGQNLSRGHLTPSADFVITDNRRTTYQLINHAPQWLSINEGNWAQLENKIRDKAARDSLDLKIITGTYGVLTLPNDQGNPTEIYLVEGDKVPVPEIFWKVVYHDDQGIAFISVNTPINPYQQEYCTNICNANRWGDWSDYKLGRIYCCTVSDLQNLIPYIPVTGITYILEEN